MQVLCTHADNGITYNKVYRVIESDSYYNKYLIINDNGEKVNYPMHYFQVIG